MDSFNLYNKALYRFWFFERSVEDIKKCIYLWRQDFQPYRIIIIIMIIIRNELDLERPLHQKPFNL